MSRIQLTVVGGGYVGLVTACCFTDFGLHVSLVESDDAKFRQLEDGLCPFYEPGLSELLKQGLQSQRLSLFRSLKEALEKHPSQAVFVAVGTPQAEDGSCDVTYVNQVVDDCIRLVQKPTVLVLKSTVPVGASAEIKKRIQAHGREAILKVVNNPEFLRQGTAVNDFMKPDRVVIGSSDVEATALMKQIYEPLLRNGHPFLVMGHESAELSKYAANLMLASRISTMNQIARLSSAVGADILEIQKVVKTDHRIGSHYLYAGLGYGGSCFPKDVKAFNALCREKGVDASLSEAVDGLNQSQRLFFLETLCECVTPNESVGVLGLSFKPNTDDIRESVSLTLLPELIKRGYSLRVHDPKAQDVFATFLNPEQKARTVFCKDALETLRGTSAMVLLTEWHEYQQLTPEDVLPVLKEKILFDGKNVFSPQQWKDAGFRYFGVGRS